MQNEYKGTYIQAHLSHITKQQIYNYSKLADIPNRIPLHKLHCTLVCNNDQESDTSIPYTIYNPNLVGYPTKLEIFKTLTGNNCLVLLFNCDYLYIRHNNIKEQLNITHYYPQYISHITLSYDINTLDIKELPNITHYVSSIEIIGESHTNQGCNDCIVTHNRS